MSQLAHNIQDAKNAGIHGENLQKIYTQGMALDTAMLTSPNIGIPTEMLTYLDNEVIEILTAPRSARKLGVEVKKGDYTTPTAKFAVVEHVGTTDPYNDYSDGGSANFNAEWVSRDSYLFSTTRQYGDLEQAKTAKAKINLATETQKAAASILDNDANIFYFYGVAGLRNYGILNDPALPAPIAPAPTGVGNSVLWANKGGEQIYNDILDLFQQLVDQTGGNVDQNSEIKLVLSPTQNRYLGDINSLGNRNVMDMLKGFLTNLTVETAVQYASNAGQLIQMIAPKIQAQDTIWLGYNEKYYSFAPVRKTSSIVQKFRAGTYGAIIRRPMAVASMLGA